MQNWTIDPLRLRDLRERAELRAADLATEISCHRGHYYKFEAGAAQPSAVLARAIARVLGTRLGRTVDFDDFADPRDTTEGAA